MPYFLWEEVCLCSLLCDLVVLMIYIPSSTCALPFVVESFGCISSKEPFFLANFLDWAWEVVKCEEVIDWLDLIDLAGCFPLLASSSGSWDKELILLNVFWVEWACEVYDVMCNANLLGGGGGGNGIETASHPWAWFWGGSTTSSQPSFVGTSECRETWCWTGIPNRLLCG